MSDEYPLPAHAAYIWLRGDQIFLGLPPLPGNRHGHTVHFTADERGIQIMLDILRARSFTQTSGIGTRGAPVQYDIEQIRKVMDRKKAEAEKDLELEFLTELGL